MKDEARKIRYATMMNAWYPLLPPSPNRHPKCFESMARFEEWLEAAPSTISHDGFCEDCTRGMQREMMKAGRCEFPSTDFPGVRNFDEAVIGKPSEELHPDAAERVKKRKKKKAAA